MERLTISPRRGAQFALAAVAVIVVGALAVAASQALAPFVIGLVLLYFVAPVVNRLAARMPRVLAILLVYLLIGLLFALLFIFLIPPLLSQIGRLINAVPSVAILQSWVQTLLTRYHALAPDALEPQIESAIQSSIPSIQGALSTFVRNVFGFLLARVGQLFDVLSFIVGLLIIPIWLFYLLNDQRKATAFVNRLLHFRMRADVWNIWRLIDRALGAYLRGQLTLGLIIGLAVGVCLFILDLAPNIEVDYILLLALWAGVCELIPMVGALLGMIPGVIIAFAVGGPVSAIAVAIMYIIIQQIENNLLVPRIIGDSVGVHPAILTVTLLAMGSVFGLAGIIAAAPLTAIARDLYLYAYRRLGGAEADEVMQTLAKPGAATM